MLTVGRPVQSEDWCLGWEGKTLHWETETATRGKLIESYISCQEIQKCAFTNVQCDKLLLSAGKLHVTLYLAEWQDFL